MNRRGSKDSGYGTISRLILANMIQPSAGHSSRPPSLFIPNGENPDLGDVARWMPVKKVKECLLHSPVSLDIIETNMDLSEINQLHLLVLYRVTWPSV